MKTQDLGNDVIYIQPFINPLKFIKKIYFGVDIFEDGFINNQNKDVEKTNNVKLEVYEVEQNGV